MTSSINWTLSKVLAFIVLLISTIFSFTLVAIAAAGDQAVNIQLIEKAVISLGSGIMWASLLMGVKTSAQAFKGGQSSEKSRESLD